MARSEVELMSLCGTLYPSFALESFANTCLGLFFVYLSVLITSKGKLKTPARDTVRFLHEVLNFKMPNTLVCKRARDSECTHGERHLH
eukprot:869425-Amphidinium_carterae.1